MSSLTFSVAPSRSALEEVSSVLNLIPQIVEYNNEKTIPTTVFENFSKNLALSSVASTNVRKSNTTTTTTTSIPTLAWTSSKYTIEAMLRSLLLLSTTIPSNMTMINTVTTKNKKDKKPKTDVNNCYTSALGVLRTILLQHNVYTSLSINDIIVR